MSLKAKDLTYGRPAQCVTAPELTGIVDKSQPTFLRRLRGELAGDDSARQERPVPRNKRLRQDDDDDAPTYVLEGTSQSLTKTEYEALLAGKDPNDSPPTAETDKLKETSLATQPKDNIAEVGKASKKRKVAKVIGKEKEDEAKDTRASDSKIKMKPKKKTKPVKLSFGDQEEG